MASIKKDTKEQTRTKKSKEAFLEALKVSLGVVTDACKEAGIGRTAYYRWYKEDEEFRAAVDSVEDITLDFAEAALYKLIKQGNVTAAIFYLKTKGKKRGYVERTEVDNISPQEITITRKIVK